MQHKVLIDRIFISPRNKCVLHKNLLEIGMVQDAESVATNKVPCCPVEAAKWKSDIRNVSCEEGFLQMTYVVDPRL